MACTCDGPNPLFCDLGMEILKENGGWGVPTLKPRPEENFLALARKAEESGVNAIATDIDAAGNHSYEKGGTARRTLARSSLEEDHLRGQSSVILKGS